MVRISRVVWLPGRAWNGLRVENGPGAQAFRVSWEARPRSARESGVERDWLRLASIAPVAIAYGRRVVLAPGGGSIPHVATFGPYPARCIAIHDGDTVTFDIDLGFGVVLSGQGLGGQPRLACRVYGINAPELSTQAGKDALAFAVTLIKPGDVCKVLSHGFDKYGGRYDGEITLPDGSDFARAMLDSGNAVPYKV